MRNATHLPPGLARCEACGGVSGTTLEKYLARNPYVTQDPDYDPERRVTALCRCHGPLCRVCGVNRIHRPISGHYHEDINRVLHVPYFHNGLVAKNAARASGLRLFKLRKLH